MSVSVNVLERGSSPDMRASVAACLFEMFLYHPHTEKSIANCHAFIHMLGYYVQHPNKITNASSRDISGVSLAAIPCSPLPTHRVQNIIIHATLMPF